MGPAQVVASDCFVTAELANNRIMTFDERFAGHEQFHTRDVQQIAENSSTYADNDFC